MRYIARHYVRVGQERYTPGEMLSLEDRETALSMIRRGALEETVEDGEETAAEEAPEEAEETEEDETQERQTNVTPDLDVSAAIRETTPPKEGGKAKWT